MSIEVKKSRTEEDGEKEEGEKVEPVRPFAEGQLPRDNRGAPQAVGGDPSQLRPRPEGYREVTQLHALQDEDGTTTTTNNNQYPQYARCHRQGSRNARSWHKRLMMTCARR